MSAETVRVQQRSEAESLQAALDMAANHGLTADQKERIGEVLVELVVYEVNKRLSVSRQTVEVRIDEIVPGDETLVNVVVSSTELPPPPANQRMPRPSGSTPARAVPTRTVTAGHHSDIELGRLEASSLHRNG
jgi:hypothetical protein